MGYCMEVIMAEATQQTYFTETPLERVHRIRDAIAAGGMDPAIAHYRMGEGEATRNRASEPSVLNQS